MDEVVDTVVVLVVVCVEIQVRRCCVVVVRLTSKAHGMDDR